MSLFVHERPTLTLIDFLVQIVSESISNRVDYKIFFLSFSFLTYSSYIASFSMEHQIG